MLNQSILVVEDEAPIREMLELVLTREGFEMLEAADVQQAWSLMLEQTPAMVLLDVMLPGISGTEFIRQLKKNEITREIPVIMLTAKASESDKIRGLELGADDYITKPFSPRELIARVKAVMRRSIGNAHSASLQVKELLMQPTEHRVTIAGKDVNIGPTEFRLLHFFMTHPNRVYSRSQVLDHVWGANAFIEERTVDVHIRRLRKVLEVHQYASLVQTVRGVGYRFTVE
ncbi:MAG: phosphate regulon transcriptional regulator PhoB [Pseudomonadota bacterium]